MWRSQVAISRKFVDSDGVHWQVYLLTPAGGGYDDDGGREGWLYFFSRGVTRSLAPFPDDWYQMDWPGLERLCHRARPPVRRETAAAEHIAHGA
jgi:hypothetical protein